MKTLFSPTYRRKNKTNLTLVLNVNRILKRTMFRGIINTTTTLSKTSLPSVPSRSMGVRTAFNFKSATGKQYAPDHKGDHVVQTTAICDKPNCETKACYTACGKLEKMSVKGNYTHKAPPGSDSVYVAAIDFKGNQQDQYFVKAGTKIEIPAETMKDLTENDMKPNINVNNYALQHDVYDKIK